MSRGSNNSLGKESIEGHFRHPLNEDTLDIDRNTVDPILTGMVGGGSEFRFEHGRVIRAVQDAHPTILLVDLGVSEKPVGHSGRMAKEVANGD